MPKFCAVEGCGRVHQAKGYCTLHYKRLVRLGEAGESKPRLTRPTQESQLCSVEGCTIARFRRGMCRVHLTRVQKHGHHGPVGRLVAEKGSGALTPDGYRLVYKPDHPGARMSGQILEHILVMTEHIGRPLYPDETVHHKNGNRQDSNIGNLELRCSGHGKGQDINHMIDWALEVLRRYRPELVKV